MKHHIAKDETLFKTFRTSFPTLPMALVTAGSPVLDLNRKQSAGMNYVQKPRTRFPEHAPNARRVFLWVYSKILESTKRFCERVFG